MHGPASIIAAARAANARLAFAESCTGGRLSAAIVSVEGASDVFLGGVVAYSNALKRGLLGVPRETLDAFGAVSSETALAMVRGVARATGATHAVSVTGVAGPGGGSAEKPVGLVYIGLLAPGVERAERFLFPGGRGAVQTLAVNNALRVLGETFASQK